MPSGVSFNIRVIIKVRNAFPPPTPEEIVLRHIFNAPQKF
jgi:hypothetical protein